jgi:hypothetical protein
MNELGFGGGSAISSSIAGSNFIRLPFHHEKS